MIPRSEMLRRARDAFAFASDREVTTLHAVVGMPAEVTGAAPGHPSVVARAEWFATAIATAEREEAIAEDAQARCVLFDRVLEGDAKAMEEAQIAKGTREKMEAARVREEPSGHPPHPDDVRVHVSITDGQRWAVDGRISRLAIEASHDPRGVVGTQLHQMVERIMNAAPVRARFGDGPGVDILDTLTGHALDRIGERYGVRRAGRYVREPSAIILSPRSSSSLDVDTRMETDAELRERIREARLRREGTYNARAEAMPAFNAIVNAANVMAADASADTEQRLRALVEHTRPGLVARFDAGDPDAREEVRRLLVAVPDPLPLRAIEGVDVDVLGEEFRRRGW